jgi:Flp pilus assembly protein TadD
MSTQEEYDDAMFDFSTGQFAVAAEKLQRLLAGEPGHFDAQLALGMAWYRQGDFARAIEEGHKANEQLVHTNLSLFYMKAGDKTTAEHHGLQARIASWKTPATAEAAAPSNPELEMAKPAPPPPTKFPSMPWKKKSEESA